MPKNIKLFNFKSNEKPNKHLQDHPYLHKNFRMVICGVSGSGKTQFLYNLLFTKEFLLKMVKESRSVFFIPSTDVVDELAEIADTNNLDHESFKIYPEWREAFCEAEYSKLDKKQTNFFVFDDVSFLQNFSKVNKKNILDQIVCAGRHKNAYSIMLTQRYTHLNENIRSNNCTVLVIFNGLNGKELDRIYVENFSLMDRNAFDKLIKENLDEKFKFIIYNKKDDKLFNNNFEEILYK